MNEDNRDPFKSFDFDQFFGGKTPFIPSDQSENSGWIENYVQGVLNNAMRSFRNITQEGLQTETSETDHHVIVRIRVPETLDPRHLRVLASTSDIKLEGLPGNKEHVIKLPTLVHSKTGKYHIKGDLLKIEIRKQNANDSYHQVIRRNE